MTIRFAPARAGFGNPVARHLGAQRIPAAANDSLPTRAGRANEAVIYEALRHFGQHGLAAAKEARANAMRAHSQGDGEGFDYWLAICRQFDKRMARACMEQTKSFN